MGPSTDANTNHRVETKRVREWKGEGVRERGRGWKGEGVRERERVERGGSKREGEGGKGRE